MTQPAALIWFGVIAVLLFVAGQILARRRRAAPISSGRSDGMQPLIEAAEAAHKTARDERLPLAVVADRSGDAVAFFVRSISSVVTVWRKSEGGGFDAATSDCDAQSLYIRRHDLQTYLRWARTVK